MAAIVKPIDLKHHAELVLTAEISSIDRDHLQTLLQFCGAHIDIVKSGNGQAVPEEEPMILFRGRDRLGWPMLDYYRKLCIGDGCNDFQLGQVDELIRRFAEFSAKNPQTMKQPGITRGL